MVIKYFWLLLVGWLVEKSKMHPEKRRISGAHHKEYSIYGLFGFGIICFLTFSFFSVTIFNKKKNPTNITTVLLVVILITEHEGTISVPYIFVIVIYR